MLDTVKRTAWIFHRDKTGDFTIRFNPERFKIAFDKNGDPLVMRDPISEILFIGTEEPEGLMVQHPCGTKHFFNYEQNRNDQTEDQEAIWHHQQLCEAEEVEPVRSSEDVCETQPV
jgi:hypothetical protein